jgi:hypothetical protein
MVILVASLLFGRPDVGLELVALWTIVSLIFHAVRLARPMPRRPRAADHQLAGVRMAGWLDRAGARRVAARARSVRRSHGTDLKALIPVGGVPMVARPAAALLAAPEIARCACWPSSPSGSRRCCPTIRGCRSSHRGDDRRDARGDPADPATRFPLLVTTADHALLDPAMIADFCAQGGGRRPRHRAGRARALMRGCRRPSGPGSSFAAGPIRGANLFAFGSRGAAKAVALWRSVEQDRKKGWRMIAALGPALLLGAVLRCGRSTRRWRASARLGLTIRKVELANPLAAVDVDKPADHALVSAILEGRA